MRRLLPALPLGLLACTACDRSSSPPADPAPFRIEVLEVTPCPAPPGLDTTKTRVLGVRVRVESNHSRGVPANYFYGSVLATDRSRYLAELPGCSPVLSGAPLYAGEHADGFLNFPVPLNKQIDSLVYAPRLGGAANQESSLSVALASSPTAPPAEEDEQ
ncbi:MAG TPA: hypothetical protein VLC09_09230 [Polyangiaceae bacterium]|nr:hypothetical protein [Polyangiaceae bacterium]